MKIGRLQSLRNLKMKWFDPQQPIGSEERYNHGKDCLQHGERSGDYRGRLYVKRTEYGWIWYCHNCGASGRKVQFTNLSGGTLPSQKGTIENRGRFRETEQGTIAVRFGLPRDFDRQIPELGTRWLLRYISQGEVSDYGIGWSNYFHRVVLPVFGHNGLAAYQLRKVDNTKKGPKYLTFKNKEIKDGIFFHSTLPNTRLNAGHDTICLVEDILSAIKVGRVCTGIALLGSPPTLPHIAQHLGNAKRVMVWLDRDKLKTAVRYVDTLNMLGYRGQMILTQQDPKTYDTDRIREEIQ